MGRVPTIEKPVPLELIPVWMITLLGLRVAATVSLATASVSG